MTCNELYTVTAKKLMSLQSELATADSRKVLARISKIAGLPQEKREAARVKLGLGDWEIYRNENDSVTMSRGDDVVIGFSNTRLNSKNTVRDLTTDSMIATGTEFWSDRYSDAEIVARNATQQYKTKRIVLTGHSLGGRMADKVANNLNMHSVTFNQGNNRVVAPRFATAISDLAESLGMFLTGNPNAGKPKATHINYVVPTDVISRQSLTLPGRTHVKWEKKDEHSHHDLKNFF